MRQIYAKNLVFIFGSPIGKAMIGKNKEDLSIL